MKTLDDYLNKLRQDVINHLSPGSSYDANHASYETMAANSIAGTLNDYLMTGNSSLEDVARAAATYEFPFHEWLGRHPELLEEDYDDGP